MGTGKVIYLKYIDGLMITVSQEPKKISYHKLSLLQKPLNLTLDYENQRLIQLKKEITNTQNN